MVSEINFRVLIMIHEWRTRRDYLWIFQPFIYTKWLTRIERESKCSLSLHEISERIIRAWFKKKKKKPLYISQIMSQILRLPNLFLYFISYSRRNRPYNGTRLEQRATPIVITGLRVERGALWPREISAPPEILFSGGENNELWPGSLFRPPSLSLSLSPSHKLVKSIMTSAASPPNGRRRLRKRKKRGKKAWWKRWKRWNRSRDQGNYTLQQRRDRAR